MNGGLPLDLFGPDLGPYNRFMEHMYGHGVALDQASQPGLDELGIEPPHDPGFDEQTFHPTAIQRVLESLAHAHLQPPRARNFGEGLLSGAIGGLQTQGAQVASARDRFNARQTERRRLYDNERKTATDKYREERSQTLKDVSKRQADDRSKQAAYDRDNPIVTQKDIDNAPAGSILSRLNPGQRLAGGFTSTALKPGGEDGGDSYAEIEKKAAARARGARMGDPSAAARDERRVATAERQARSTESTIIGKIQDDYEANPLIKGYGTLRSNLKSATAASALKSGPGDIALIFAFMRGLEPENPNAVREGEYSNARQATGKLQTYSNLPNRFFNGTQLTDEGRAFFLKQMRNALASRRPDFDAVNGQFRRRSSAVGVDPSLFMREFGSDTTATAPSRVIRIDRNGNEVRQ